MGRVYIWNQTLGKNIEVHYKIHTVQCQKCKQINKEKYKIKSKNNEKMAKKQSSQIYSGKVLFCKDHPKGKAQQRLTHSESTPCVSRLPIILRLIGRQ